MRLHSLVPAMLGGIVLCGCTALGSQAWYEGYTRAPLLKHASFDMACAEGELHDQPLEGYMTIGVRGCGKQATYKYVDTVGWVMNTGASSQKP
jgi:hypothetical protein